MRWAALFPGQGSQSSGMGKLLADRFGAARRTFSEADEVLGEHLSKLCFEGPDEELRMTRNTQPALLTVSVATWRVLLEHVELPVVAAGHSLGEYSALVAAGTLSFPDALRAVRLRGEAMQRAVPVGAGAMAALIGASSEVVDQLCAAQRKPGEVLVAANYNAPDQIVVAGHREAVERLIAAASAAGVKRAVLLPVSAPFHCAMMSPAAEELAGCLRGIEFRAPRFAVRANVDALPLSSGAQAQEKLIEQVVAPVLWVKTMQAIERDDRVALAVEVGAGKVLSGLSRKIHQDLKCVACGTPEELVSVAAQLAGANSS